MDAGRTAVGATWAAALSGVAAILVLVPGLRALEWLALAVGLAVAVAMAGQLVVAERAGFVVRLAAAATGAFLLIGLAALLVLLRG